MCSRDKGVDSETVTKKAKITTNRIWTMLRPTVTHYLNLQKANLEKFMTKTKLK